MPRQPRIEFAGAVYHLVNRGDRGEVIFQGDEDRERFIATLGAACAKTNWRIHAYCLLPDHFHLVVETPQANLVSGMKWFLGTYTIQFNRRHNQRGHLFSGRYKSLLIEKSAGTFLQQVCEYVLLSPVQAGLVTPQQALTTFAWSSYASLLQAPENRPAWLQTDLLFQQLGLTDTPAGRAAFEQQMEAHRADIKADRWKNIRRGWCLGSDEFRNTLLQAAEKPGSQVKVPRKEAALAKAEAIVNEEMADLQWTHEDLQLHRKADPEKLRIARRLRQETTISLKWIADRLGMGSWTYLANNLYNLSAGAPTQPKRRIRKPPAQKRPVVSKIIIPDLPIAPAVPQEPDLGTSAISEEELPTHLL